MPFTPFHLGPGALFKGIGGERFSFMVFGGSQVLIDIEPGYRMIAGDAVLHGPTHTLGGAAAIAIVATLVGKPVSEFALRLIRYPRPHVSWVAAATGAFVGTFSHVVLDAVTHTDMLPWRPFTDGNGLLGAASLSTMQWVCVAAGLVGATLFALRRRRDG